MSHELALQALASGEASLDRGDHAEAIERFEAAADYFLADDRHMQAVRAYRRIFCLDMLRRQAPERLAAILDRLGKIGCRDVWQEHLDQLQDVQAKWPFRTATVRLATVDFDEESGEGFVGYLEGSDPMARLGRVSTTLIRCHREAEFAFLTDIMLANIVADAASDWGKADPDLKFELEIMGTGRTFLISGQGGLTLADTRKEAHAGAAPTDERLLALLYEADLLATFGMADTARAKYAAVLELDPHNERAKSAMIRIDEAAAAALAKEQEPTNVGRVPTAEAKVEAESSAKASASPPDEKKKKKKKKGSSD